MLIPTLSPIIQLASLPLLLVVVLSPTGWSRTLDIAKSTAADSVERPLLERHAESSGLTQVGGDTGSVMADDPFESIHSGMREGAGMNIRLKAKEREEDDADLLMAKKHALNKMPKKITALLVEPLIDEYQQDPFEGVTAWPLPEFSPPKEEKSN